MIQKLLGKRTRGAKSKKKRVRRTFSKTEDATVPSRQYNELIDYYTEEMNYLHKEIERLKEQNTLIMKTAMKQGERVKEFEEKQAAKDDEHTPPSDERQA